MRSFPRESGDCVWPLPASGACVVLPQLPAHREIKQPPPFPLFLLDIVDIFISILEVSEISVFSFRQHNVFYLVIIQRIVTSCPQPDALSRDAGYTIVLYLKICNWCHRRHYTWHRFIRFIYGMFKIIMWDSKIGPCIWF